MSALTELQIIRMGGRPAFVVVPVEQWEKLTGQAIGDVLLPHEVVALMASHDLSPIAAWRQYRGYTQRELGERMGFSIEAAQPSVAQLEASGSKPQKKTLERAAAALGVDIQQLKI